MVRERRYTDEALADAILSSTSWRGVLRHLGLSATSASAIRSVRNRADLLDLDTSHFTGQRRWTDDELTVAVREAASWAEVTDRLGLSGGSATTTLKGHAARLRLSTEHLGRAPDISVSDGHLEWGRPASAYLGRAGSLLAAAWFAHSGYTVSWPLEPAAYDLMVELRNRSHRIQVKTTTVRAGQTWVARITRSGMNHGTYDPDDLDQFFVIDGDLNYYLIPVSTVGGLQAIHLARYQRFRLER